MCQAQLSASQNNCQNQSFLVFYKHYLFTVVFSICQSYMLFLLTEEILFLISTFYNVFSYILDLLILFIDIDYRVLEVRLKKRLS